MTALAAVFLLAMTPVADVQFAKSSNAFAFDLYKEVRKAPGNRVVSPASLTIALTMAWGGARGETADEMRRVLRLEGNPAEVMNAANGLMASLSEPGPVQMRIANRLYGDKGYGFDPGYLEAIRSGFGAGLVPVDFRSAPDAARVTINRWVEEQTAERIQNLIPPRGITPLTRLALVNAVRFVGPWAKPFRPSETRPAPFRTTSADAKDVPTMHVLASFPHVADKAAGLQAIELPYLGMRFSMVIVLPDAGGGLPALEERLTSEMFDALLRATDWTNVDLALPRFEIDPSASLSLAETLAALGMPSAFDPGRADLTGIANPKDRRDGLYISSAFHKAFVKIDEKGTEAAAGSAVLAAARSLPRQLKVDHPFLFVIRDTASGLILFMGRVVDPTTK